MSLNTQTDTVNINDRVYSSVFNAATRTFTDVSPEARQSTTAIDNLGRIVQTQLANLHPVTFSYDTRGRLQTTSQGIGGEARITAFSYNADGYLETMSDPENRTTRFTYDLAGRVKQQTLPGNRVINYDYDFSGNLTSLTPPGKPGHGFDYSAVDLVKEYDPPAAVFTGARVTAYEYGLCAGIRRGFPV